MQVLDTHVSNSSDGMVIVEFKGEGRELAAVTMAGGDGSLDGDHAVLRAKEIMVQLTAFDDAGSTEGIGQQGGGSAPGSMQSEVEPIFDAAPGSHIRAD